jgi:hypothetical protein
MLELKVKADIRGLEELTVQYPQASEKARRTRLTEASLLLERAIKELTPVGAGPIHLRDTVFSQTVSQGLSISSYLGTPAVYGEPVEYGTKPHFPPVAPIRHWVERKLGLSGSEAAGVASSSRGHLEAGHEPAKLFAAASTSRRPVMGILEQIPDDIVRMVNA